jgi:uncharacterized membrane protein (UPF0127 family)
MDIQHADTFRAKLIGLLGTKQFPEYDGLFFQGVNCIHTFFMQYPIDVLFLDKENVVLKITEKIKPFRVVWGPDKSFGVLELRAGAAAEMKIKIGDTFHLEGKKDG